ncbi:MAG: hypothetical protein ABID61_01520 [Candidatus Micrarchaeota archaeon]
MNQIVISFLILGLVAGVVHADIGPGPENPDITVYLVKNNISETSISDITYHCEIPGSGTSPMDDREAIFLCEDGTCWNNGGWFYKLNPCFGFATGYFSYDYNSTQMRTQTFTPYVGKSEYTYILDVENGIMTEQQKNNDKDPSCFTAFVLLGLVSVVVIRR